jgi:hypothetical protein
VFPITGLPELPKSAAGIPPQVMVPPPLLNMSSAMAEKFNQLGPAQKQQLIKQMIIVIDSLLNLIL